MMMKVLAATALLLAGVCAHIETDEAQLHMRITKQQRSTEECDDNCERDWMPVCGSDGVTYGNDCLLEFAQCEDESISKAADGKCLNKKKPAM